MLPNTKDCTKKSRLLFPLWSLNFHCGSDVSVVERLTRNREVIGSSTNRVNTEKI